MLGEATDALQDEPGELHTGDGLCENINFRQLQAESAIKASVSKLNEVDIIKESKELYISNV